MVGVQVLHVQYGMLGASQDLPEWKVADTQ